MRVRIWSATAAVAFVATVIGLNAMPVEADYVRDGQWHLSALHMQDAWAMSKGQGVTVGVLDSGVMTGQADLTGQVTTGPDFRGGPAKPGDAFWGFHGTAMASLIAGHGHGAGNADGAIGIAPEAKILGVRVTWDDNDPIQDLPPAQQIAEGAKPGDPLAQGIRYAADHGVQVINMSLGYTAGDAAMVAQDEQAVQYAVSKGVVVVASAGNDGDAGNQLSFPAGLGGVIAVGASDKNGTPASFSTHTWDTSVSAPGVGVVSGSNTADYITADGTSPASAIVAGVCALIRSRYPHLSPQQIKSLLESTTRRPSSGTYTEAEGWGIIQPVAALQKAASLKVQPEALKAAPAAQFLGSGQLPVLGLNSSGTRALWASVGLLAISLGMVFNAGVLIYTSRRR